MIVIDVFTLLVVLFLLYILIRLVRNDAIFIPTPKKQIRRILKEVGLSKKDILFDLGSGDGRVVEIAAKEFGCKAIGIENSVVLYYYSKIHLRNVDNTKIIHSDVFKVNLSDATVIYAYLSKKLMKMLKRKFEKELKRGAIVITLDHEIPGWKPTKKIRTGHFYTYVYKT